MEKYTKKPIIKKQIGRFHIKRYIKLVLCAAFVCILFAGAPPAPLFSQTQSGGAHSSFSAFFTSRARTLADQITTQPAPSRPGTMGLIITGEVPLFEAVSNESLREGLVQRFTTQNNNFVQTHMASAHSIDYTTSIYTFGRFVSVVVVKEAVSASANASVFTAVIDSTANNIISLQEYNVNALRLVNSHIRNIIAENPRGFVTGFTGISQGHPFYLNNDGELVIPFASAELMPENRDVHRVTLDTRNIIDVSLDENYFHTLPQNQYNTVMVRLAYVIGRFGYTTEWDADSRTVYIFRDGEQVSSVTIDNNAYYYGGTAPRELEVAPMLSSAGFTYVPLSFFDEILGISTVVDSNGNIIMSKYASSINIQRVAIQSEEFAEDDENVDVNSSFWDMLSLSTWDINFYFD